ncbi:MAG: glycosyltransferase family 4 protein [Candidatus Schekmanbacteria bacterium]|nr:glycosyltransferase family 4 protein [Candidatus Schekmanbacteria bacterium]
MFTVIHTESSEGWGGQENRTLQEAIGLKKLGARVLIFCQPNSKLAIKAKAEGLEVFACPIRQSYDLVAIKRLLDLIKTENIDIINTHSGKDSLLGAIAGRLSRKKPVIVRTRHLALPITSKITYSLLPHKIVTVSGYVKDYLVKEGIDSHKIAAIPTGVDLEKFDPNKVSGGLKQELNLPAATPLVGTIAILRGKKGHRILLEAVPSILDVFPDAHFIFAGNGPQQENLAKKIKESGLEKKIKMLGLRQDIPNVLKSIDVFVLPTLQEALGTAFIEAMAMEVPVIGTAVGGVTEVIKDGVNGYLVEPNNPADLAGKIITVLKDREKTRQMGKEGRKIVEQSYSTATMCAKMFSLYESLL